MTHGTLYDPIRGKDVPDTPEERVRQATVQFLLNEIKVPAHLITVEFGLCAIDPKTDDRVDIIVSNFREGAALDKPWLLVECKAQPLPEGADPEVRDACPGRCDRLFRARPGDKALLENCALACFLDADFVRIYGRISTNIPNKLKKHFSFTNIFSSLID